MAYSKVLNRPMFNKHNSAYGRGIASNLVTDEERQRFNYGGRVGYDIGGNQKGRTYYDPEAQLTAEEILKGPLYTKPYITDMFERDYYLDTEEGTEGIPIAGMQGMIDTTADYDLEGRPILNKLERRTRKLLKENPEAYKDYFKKFSDPYKKKAIEQEKILTTGGYKDKDKDLYTKDEVIEKAEIEDPAGDGLPTDPDSDQLYTDEEKKEKRSQMMLSMAERLIGGSRDKWGSTAQMKNISGAIGDIRKIADPSERREMLAKYKAWGKAQANRDKAMYSDDMLVKQLISKGAGPKRAKESVYFGEDITQMARGPSGKTIREAFSENPGQFKIIFDEEKQVYIIPSLGKEVTSIEELIKLRKQKKI